GAPADSPTPTLGRMTQTLRTPIPPGPPPAPAVDGETGGDESGRLLRVSFPAQNLEVAREDVASASSRRVTVSRAGDEHVRVPANGFSIAATLAKPADADAKPRPGVVLVSGSGPADRDENIGGIPIF